MIVSIQYLRGIAALLVITAHFKIPYISHFCGAIGVDIFFIISGYIMSISAPKYFANPGRFIVFRIIRIYPLYVLLSLPFFLQAFLNHDYTSVFKSLLFLGGDGIKYKDPLLFSGWSLFFEMVFYVLIISIKNIKITGAVLSLFGIIGFYGFNSWINYIFNPFWIMFALGLALNTIENLLPKFHYKFSMAISMLTLSCAMLFHDNVIDSSNFLPRLFVGFKGIILPRVFVYGLASLVFVVYFKRFIDVSKFRSHLLQISGDLSYSIYLTHSAIYLIAAFVLDKFNLTNANFMLLGLLFVWPLSRLSYWLIENKLTRKIKLYHENFQRH